MATWRRWLGHLVLAATLPAGAAPAGYGPAGIAPLPGPEVPAGSRLVFVLSGPSGSGKSTLAKRLLSRLPDLAAGVSHTTRPPRPGERDGVDYQFVDPATFDALLAGGHFLEWVEAYGHRYGLGREWLEGPRARGRDLVLDLDSAGARQVRQAVPGAVTVLLFPPSAGELARRLKARRTESAEQLALRLDQARRELERFPEYDYLVVNDNLDQAGRELAAIVLAARARRERRAGRARAILAGFGVSPSSAAGPGTARD